MKKLLFAIFCLLPLSSYSSLPSKYVKISQSSSGDIIYGNTKDSYGNGSAWIVWNHKKGNSSIARYHANCGRNTLGYTDEVTYQKKDLKGKVLYQSGGSQLGSTKNVIPDTIGESIFNFICYGMY